jgi:hypothetical protein
MGDQTGPIHRYWQEPLEYAEVVWTGGDYLSPDLREQPVSHPATLTTEPHDRTRIKPARRRLVAALARLEPMTWYSLKELAARANVSPSTCREYVQAFVAMGLLERRAGTRRFAGSWEVRTPS